VRESEREGQHELYSQLIYTYTHTYIYTHTYTL
jgi:hypothetical protein